VRNKQDEKKDKQAVCFQYMSQLKTHENESPDDQHQPTYRAGQN